MSHKYALQHIHLFDSVETPMSQDVLQINQRLRKWLGSGLSCWGDGEVQDVLRAREEKQQHKPAHLFTSGERF